MTKMRNSECGVNELPIVNCALRIVNRELQGRMENL